MGAGVTTWSQYQGGKKRETGSMVWGTLLNLESTMPEAIASPLTFLSYNPVLLKPV